MISANRHNLIYNLRCVLEVSAEKPGNVTPSHNFKDTSYEHFLAGGIALGPAIRSAASSGFKGKPEIGKNILKAVSDVKRSHSGGNTHLGIAMLMVPVAAGAGMCVAENKKINLKRLQSKTKKIVESTAVEDSLHLYDAINLANAGGLGKPHEFDLLDENSKQKLITENVTLNDIMKISAGRDLIAEELAYGMEITFSNAKVLSGIYRETGDIGGAITGTYLAVLSQHPDTLIARKVGIERAEEISKRAEKIICLEQEEYNGALKKFDAELRSQENKLNPGTTADIVACSLFLALLEGIEL